MRNRLDILLYFKSTYSSFGNPDLKSLMARAGRIVITGVMSGCCVLATAMMEFVSPTHTAVMTCGEYVALRQG